MKVCVVVLTALEIEYAAVREGLDGLETVLHPEGTIFETGRVRTGGATVALVQTGEGNTNAAVFAERAKALFQPKAMLFAGVAGGLRDEIELGDIVVGTKIYGYHGGKDTDAGFLSRPQVWDAPHELEQLARHVARTRSWPCAIHFKPIAAGEVVLNSRRTPLAEQLRTVYNDAAAVEMEGAGLSRASHLNRKLPVLSIRGISDRADGMKHPDEDARTQPVAARHAAAFALALAEQLHSLRRWRAPLTRGVQLPLSP
ncbi:5'-methylthioadenosine/S-adenosylhomocysteine nucleosidase [Actinocorallia lasiicapitis]